MRFLTAEIVYRALQREAPEDLYPDGAPSAFFSTADQFATAKEFEALYSNLGRIYENIFPGSADELMSQWENTIFGFPQSQLPTLADAQARLLEKINRPRGINRARIEAIVESIVGPDVVFEIADWGCEEFAWFLDISELDINTNLNSGNGSPPGGQYDQGLNCRYLTSPPPGMNMDEWQSVRTEAYTYSVLIYDYVLSDPWGLFDERSALEAALKKVEPARSAHFIQDGLDSNDMLSGST